jgi:putative ABC transport system permease protein
VNITLAIGEAARSLAAHKVRSVLTMLGIVIGVASVLLMLEVGDAVRRHVDVQLAQLGRHTLVVQADPAHVPGRRLQLQDASEIRALPEVAEAAAVLQARLTLHAGRDIRSDMTVFGVTASVFAVRHWTLAEGRPFDRADERRASRVAVIGAALAEQHFAGRGAIGQVLRIEGQPFTVMGVLAGRGQTIDGADLGQLVVVPLQALPLALPRQGMVHQIHVQARSATGVPGAQAAITELLHQRHRVPNHQPGGFQVMDLAAVAHAGTQLGQGISIGLGALAAVSLVVGGIGVMNIMLVSVEEQIRDIGVRMAIGAPPGQLLSQLLAEALLLCLCGGVVALLVAAAATEAINLAGLLELRLHPANAAAALACAAVVGLVFGWLPARRTANMQPVECLRRGP